MGHFYYLACVAACVAIYALLKSQAGIRAELHEDDQIGEGGMR